MKLSVIIPTYKRVEILSKCLQGFSNQTRFADEIVIIIHESDKKTIEYIESIKRFYKNIHTYFVHEYGQIAALNKGLCTYTGDIACIIDDDAIPRGDWLFRIEKHFENNQHAGGIGGKDYLYFDNILQMGRKKKVGIITWYGRILGYHHIGYGEARCAWHLKGVNMSFRRKAIGTTVFDCRLKGKGAQYYNDTIFCLAIREKGWQIIYDPEVAVDHYVAQRSDKDDRYEYSDYESLKNASYNEYFCLLKYLSGSKKYFGCIFSLLVGTKYILGFAQFIRMLFVSRQYLLIRLCASISGKYEALKYILQKGK